MNSRRADAAGRNLELVRGLTARFRRAKLDSPEADAESIARHFTKADRVKFYAGDVLIGRRAQAGIETAARERLRRRPLGQVLKRAWFRGIELEVNEHVLIPRPETEVLVEEALTCLRLSATKNGGLGNASVLDLGTGSGCIAIALTSQWPECRMTALDVLPQALQVARKNARRHKLEKKIEFVRSDIFSAVGGRRWDIIVANPPYIPTKKIRTLSPEVRHEPRLALDGGPEGLTVIKAILKGAGEHLNPEGTLLMEIGDGQFEAVGRMARETLPGARTHFVKDLNGIERIAIIG